MERTFSSKPQIWRPNEPLASIPVLKLDEAGQRAAARHIIEGDFGALEMELPQQQGPWCVELGRPKVQ